MTPAPTGSIHDTRHQMAAGDDVAGSPCAGRRLPQHNSHPLPDLHALAVSNPIPDAHAVSHIHALAICNAESAGNGVPDCHPVAVSNAVSDIHALANANAEPLRQVASL